MQFDDIRAVLVTLLSHPVAVAAAIVLAGFNAAIWLLVFQRIGVPTALASLLLVPPITLLLPLYVALARWPSERLPRFPRRLRRIRTRPAPRVAQRRPYVGPVPGEFDHRRPLRLGSDGLPRFRIPLLPSSSTTVFALAVGSPRLPR